MGKGTHIQYKEVNFIVIINKRTTKLAANAHNSIHLKRSKNKSSSVDTDSDGSVDLDALIAEGSDLESGEIQLNDDGLDDGDDNFWRVDPAELERHLTPSTSPLPRHSPDPPALNSLMASKEYEDDEINVIDMSLNTQITPILKPVSSLPVPSPYPTLSGRKSGILADLPKIAFSAHFGPSPLFPTFLRASSIEDPDEYETMSNGSYTSVHSTGSAKSGALGIQRPSTITAPGRDSHSSTPTPQRSRSLSVVSDSSTEESTTSSVGTCPRSMSRVSNSSTNDALVRSSASHIMSPRSRPLSRAGSHIGTPKSSNISTGSQN
ncbi:hypothetical protein C1645_813258 [Glomus cerebriforme]|uniref:Uncharacterized protein n=1 Tax=Glomus cerebriforme TaxID=658196 RepID=A0A397TKX6_9GLOM|nr:hypothetical protein C1645_813258 [Glomus cerebriforme]